TIIWPSFWVMDPTATVSITEVAFICAVLFQPRTTQYPSTGVFLHKSQTAASQWLCACFAGGFVHSSQYRSGNKRVLLRLIQICGLKLRKYPASHLQRSLLKIST